MSAVSFGMKSKNERTLARNTCIQTYVVYKKCSAVLFQGTVVWKFSANTLSGTTILHLDSLVGVDSIDFQPLVTKPLAELRTPILETARKKEFSHEKPFNNVQ